MERETVPTSRGDQPHLYRAVWEEILSALGKRSSEDHAKQLVERLSEVARRAKDKKIEAVGRDLRDFAFQKLPEILRTYQYREGQDMVRTVASRLHDILGPREALAFLIVRAETEPAWLLRQGSHAWAQHGWYFGRWRSEAKDLGDLEPRLLAIVIREIQRYLIYRTSNYREIYHNDRRYFWAEKAGDFFRAAQEVLEERKDSLETVRHIAKYLAEGLDRLDAAIDALYAYHRKLGLDEAGQRQLVEYLQDAKRFEESIPLCLAMIEKWPDEIDYRVFMLRAYFHAGRAAELQAALEAADAHFHEGGRWNKSSIASLASVCRETKLYEASVKYFDEAIALHRKTARNQGVGDGKLSEYYGEQAESYAGLGRTKEAVDAAAGAIVSWGRNIENRKKAEESLLGVVREAKDLARYAEEFEAEVEKERLEKPIVRKALGRIFFEKKDYASAAKHLEAAIESGPPDTDASRLLIESYERSGSAEQAAERVLGLARRSGHDFELYKELGERYEKLRRSADSERAYTTLAEMSANESEGHALLAGVRSAQKRFAEAAQEWQHVTRIRSKEPTGYLGMAEALIGARDFAQARETLEKVLGQAWPERFGDVRKEARKLLDRIPRAR